MPIMRLWHGEVAIDQADEYGQYMGMRFFTRNN